MENDDKVRTLELHINLMRSEVASLRNSVDENRLIQPFGAIQDQYIQPAYYPSRGTSVTIAPGDNPRGDAVGSFVPPATADYYLKCYSFEAWKTAATTIEMEPGDILLGPLSFINWADIDGYTTTPTVTSTNTHVWLEVRVDSQIEPTGSLGTGYAWLKVGTKADMRAALDSTEILTKTIVPLVETVWSAGAITKVKGLQCGDAKIYRSG